ncbi:MAG: hypothetical protein L3K09_06270 [Thermoplasmata archaeon]|nr:hypothetical protein [Thermoplasmata archaeon]
MSMPDPVKPFRDRAFLALLLLVGAAALGSGLVVLVGQGQLTPTAVFDSVLGLTVLVVSWVFLGPYVIPRAFGDPSPGEEETDRPYLPLPIAAPPPPPRARPRPSARPSPVAARPDPFEEPNWQEPSRPYAPSNPARYPRPGGVAAWVTAPWDDQESTSDDLPTQPSSPLQVPPAPVSTPPAWAGVVLPRAPQATLSPPEEPSLDADPSVLHELDEIWSSTRHTGADGEAGPIPSVDEPLFPDDPGGGLSVGRSARFSRVTAKPPESPATGEPSD